MTYVDCTMTLPNIKAKCDGLATYGITSLRFEAIGAMQGVTIHLPKAMAERAKRAAEAFNTIMNEAEQASPALAAE